MIFRGAVFDIFPISYVIHVPSEIVYKWIFAPLNFFRYGY
jgi:hypothetical protein